MYENRYFEYLKPSPKISISVPPEIEPTLGEKDVTYNLYTTICVDLFYIIKSHFLFLFKKNKRIL